MCNNEQNTNKLIFKVLFRSGKKLKELFSELNIAFPETHFVENENKECVFSYPTYANN